jgi:hypothetical protein
MLEDTAEARLRCSSISLEDGADEAWLNGEPIGFCERGMSFPSRWQFDPGTTLAMTLEICGTRERVRAEGVVVGCEKMGERLWSVTLIFLDMPPELVKIQSSKLGIRGDLSETPVAPGCSPT